ncbi:MAG: hypothetical protein IT440_01045 [Phycisphaeraceae bacterium]|nr:hypothetical protein [Phycisphaeraceae bacterium]
MNIMMDFTSGASGAGGQWTLSCGDLSRLAGCRARLVWRYAGEEAWRDEYLPLPHIAGSLMKFSLRVSAAELVIQGRKLAHGGWKLGGRLTNTSDRSIELARFHYLDGRMESYEDVTLLRLIPKQDQTECWVRMGREEPPIRTVQGHPEYWWNRSSAESLLPDPIYDEPNWSCGMDCGVFLRALAGPAWIIGATDPGIAFGEIGLRTAGADAGHFYVGQLLDNILLDPGETRELERMHILAGDWLQGLRHWAKVCAKSLGSPSRPRPLTGFCSWYRNFAQFTTTDIDQAIEQFAQLPIPPGGRMIQIDDGFQRIPGDWQPNARYPAQWWAQLPRRIAASGSIPALWLAPMTVQDSHPIVAEHPQWFARLPDGRYAITQMSWGWCNDPNWKFAQAGGHLSYNLDPDHPGAQAFIRSFLQDAVAAGWRAFKMDFNAYCFNARMTFDRRKTTFQTLRDQYRLFRETIGSDCLLNACGGNPWRFTVGLVDSARIAPDMVGNWNTIRQLLPTVLLRMAATNGIWWSADPDVFYMRGKSTTITGSYFDPVTLSTSAEEQTMLLTAIGMMGGMLYTSDLPSEWTEQARQQVLAFWSDRQPQPATNPRLVMDENTFQVRACRTDAVAGKSSVVRCALFNWSDQTTEVSVSLAELGLDETGPWSLQHTDSPVALVDGTLICTQPAHSVRTALLERQ